MRRSFLAPSSVRAILGSPHFASSAGDLCERVKRHGFAGYWVCKGAPGNPQKPHESDLVVFFLHGGAYALGHPLNTLSQLLCTAERAASENVNISVFSLQYTRAPEATFPVQFDQCIEAYQYMLDELKVHPSRVVVMGESAGGHLALAFLHQLESLSLPRPGGAFLLYPWVDLSNQGTSFKTNRYRDMLSKTDLDRATVSVLGNEGRKRFEDLINLAEPRRQGYWRTTLPQITQVNVGSNDVFVGSIACFVEHAKADGAQIQLAIIPDASHGYTVLPDAIDSKAFLQTPRGTIDGSLMRIASMYAKTLVQFANTIEGLRK